MADEGWKSKSEKMGRWLLLYLLSMQDDFETAIREAGDVHQNEPFRPAVLSSFVKPVRISSRWTRYLHMEQV